MPSCEEYPKRTTTTKSKLKSHLQSGDDLFRDRASSMLDKSESLRYFVLRVWHAIRYDLNRDALSFLLAGESTGLRRRFLVSEQI